MKNPFASLLSGRAADAPAAQTTKRINLALQGGGAHGAFTWGVLDHLLSDERLVIEGISGTSAGAVNAVMLADGLARGGRAEAIYRFPPDRAARIAVGTVASELAASPRGLDLVVFCCFAQEAADHHMAAFAKLGLA